MEAQRLSTLLMRQQDASNELALDPDAPAEVFSNTTLPALPVLSIIQPTTPKPRVNFTPIKLLFVEIQKSVRDRFAKIVKQFFDSIEKSRAEEKEHKQAETKRTEKRDRIIAQETRRKEILKDEITKQYITYMLLQT